jgi:hypothetical protein
MQQVADLDDFMLRGDHIWIQKGERTDLEVQRGWGFGFGFDVLI